MGNLANAWSHVAAFSFFTCCYPYKDQNGVPADSVEPQELQGLLSPERDMSVFKDNPYIYEVGEPVIIISSLINKTTKCCIIIEFAACGSPLTACLTTPCPLLPFPAFFNLKSFEGTMARILCSVPLDLSNCTACMQCCVVNNWQTIMHLVQLDRSVRQRAIQQGAQSMAMWPLAMAGLQWRAPQASMRCFTTGVISFNAACTAVIILCLAF